ncbi:MAG TPA: RNA polymerase factor sigma-32 [Candidatus Binataceae bacterium]|nr:RNA polymerase factor sigma-32 [Candidatus Binataceae bacterium]
MKARPLEEPIETEAEVIGEESEPESSIDLAANPALSDADPEALAASLGLGQEGPPQGETSLEDAAENSGSLVPLDALSRYLSEIRRFPLLSREEETVISKRYAKYHDPADAYRLVTANLRLVVKIANEFARATRNLLDLVQEGNVGLMEAVKHFNPEVGIRFPSYAVWWVRAYIYRFLINNWRLVKIGTTQAQRKLFFNLKKETDRLEAEGFTPQPKLLAQRMGVKESEVREMQERMAQNEISLDQPSAAAGDDDNGGNLLDALPDASYNPEEATARSEWREFAKAQVDEFAGTLEGKDLEIFQNRLLSEDPPTLQEIGARYGISRERVRQIESGLKRRFKAFLQAHAGDIDRADT